MKILWRVLMIARRYFLWTGLAYLCLLGATATNLAVPWMLEQIVDRGLVGGDREYLLFAALVMIAIHVARGGFQFGAQFLNQYVSEHVAFDLRNMLYDHLQRLSFAYHDRSKTGDLISRMTSDINLVRMFTGQDFIRIANTLFLYVAVASAMFSKHPQLALLAFATMPFMFGAATLYARRVRPLYRQLQRQFAALTDALQESLMGVRVVKAFAREPHEIEKFDRENERYLRPRAGRAPAVGGRTTADALHLGVGCRRHPVVRRAGDDPGQPHHRYADRLSRLLAPARHAHAHDRHDR